MLNKLLSIFGKNPETQQATAINLENNPCHSVRCTAKRAYEIRSILESAFAKLPAFVVNPETMHKDIENVLRSDTIRNAVNQAIMSTGAHPDTVTRFLQNVAGRYAVGAL